MTLQKLCPKGHKIVTIDKQDYRPPCEREEREKERRDIGMLPNGVPRKKIEEASK